MADAASSSGPLPARQRTEAFIPRGTAGQHPALTPVESFYQRILAGDADEAQDHAELLLKDRSLSSYYDEVALRGVQLAAEDARRGVLPPGAA